MKRKTALGISFILILAILNLWKWLPVSGGKKSLNNREASFGLVLNFPSAAAEEDKTMRRNLFALGSSSPSGHRHGSGKTKNLPASVSTVPTLVASPVFPDGSVLEVAGGYRLMGIASREGKNHALIGKGDQLFQVGVGDNIESQYQVQNITEGEVYLTEKQTGNTLKLRIWDQGSPH
jgi:hypothetical protein